MSVISLNKKLEKLRLNGMSMTVEQRLKSAQEEGWSYSSFLDILITDEIDKRNQIQLTRRLSKSCLNMDKTLAIGHISFLNGFNAAEEMVLIEEEWKKSLKFLC